MSLLTLCLNDLFIVESGILKSLTIALLCISDFRYVDHYLIHLEASIRYIYIYLKLSYPLNESILMKVKEESEKVG